MINRNAKVSIGTSARTTAAADAKLAKAAEAVVAAIALPQGVEFARFVHAGRTYAVSSSVSIRVDRLASRVPDVVIREGRAREEARQAASRRRSRR